MTTVAQLIKHLQTLPQHAIVETKDDSGCQRSFSIEDHVYLLDLRGNPNVKEDSPNYNKVWVQLGE